jgi:hypothetical protein
LYVSTLSVCDEAVARHGLIVSNRWLLICVLACEVPEKMPSSGQDNGSPPRDARPVHDADESSTPGMPMPSVDAGPPPQMSCKGNGNHLDPPKCELPPPACLDAYFVLDYTSAKCVSGDCVFERELTYCGTAGCTNGACNSAL